MRIRNAESARPLSRILWPAGLAAGTVGALSAIVLLAGKDPLQAGYDFAAGIASRQGLGAIAARGTILGLYALGIAANFRGGIISVGAEGQSRIGSATAVMLTVGAWGALLARSPLFGIPLLLIAGAAGGAAWSLIAGFMRHTRNVPEVVATLLLNFAAMPLVRYLVSTRSLLQGNTNFQKNELPTALQFGGWSGTEFHAGVFLLIPAALAVHFWVFHTPSGMRLRAMGFNSAAAKACGVDTVRLAYIAFAVSGGLAGMAGALSVMAIGALETQPAYTDYGYTAIAVALVAGSRPLWVPPAALLFAALEVGAAAMEESAGVPHWVVFILNGLLILAILVRTVLREEGKEIFAA